VKRKDPLLWAGEMACAHKSAHENQHDGAAAIDKWMFELESMAQVLSDRPPPTPSQHPPPSLRFPVGRRLLW